MLRLLEIELIKIWNSRSSRILIFSYFGLLTFLSLFSIIKFKLGDFEIYLAKEGIYDFPYIWHFNTYIADIFKLFLAMVIVSMIASEYSNKTLKQNLIDGLSKKEFILSKFITVVFLSLLSTLMVFVVSLILGLIYSSYNEMGIIFSQLEFLAAYFFKLVCFFSMCLFFAVLVRKSAFSLGFLVLWYIFESIIRGVTFFITGNSNPFWYQFFPLQAMSNLIKEPFTRMNVIRVAANQLGADISLDYKVQLIDILIVTIWIFLFVYLSYYLIKRRDL